MKDINPQIQEAQQTIGRKVKANHTWEYYRKWDETNLKRNHEAAKVSGEYSFSEDNNNNKS